MSLLGPRRRTAVCLLLAGLTGMCGCDVLTDAPLTDSEMSAFLAEADSRATRSRGRAFQATAVAAADQRSAITGALSLSRIRSDAAAEAATLATRVGAVASDLSQAESTGLEVARSALDQAMCAVSSLLRHLGVMTSETPVGVMTCETFGGVGVGAG
mgnify:CR=1 FL=1